MVAVDQLVILGTQGSEYPRWVNAYGRDEDVRQVPSRRLRADVVRDGQIPRAVNYRYPPRPFRSTQRQSTAPSADHDTHVRLTRPPTDADTGDRAWGVSLGSAWLELRMLGPKRLRERRLGQDPPHAPHIAAREHVPTDYAEPGRPHADTDAKT